MKGRIIRWFALLGCAGIAALVIAGVVNATGRYFLLVVIGALALLAVAEGVRTWRQRALARRFRREHPDKDLVLVYTDSPHWAPYIEERWLARWADRALVFNRSRPWSRDQLEARLWRAYAGALEHTPLAIVIPQRNRPIVVRLWHAFRDAKHGKERRLREAEAKLEDALSRSRR